MLFCPSRPEFVWQGGKAGGKMCTEVMGVVVSVGVNGPASMRATVLVRTELLGHIMSSVKGFGA